MWIMCYPQRLKQGRVAGLESSLSCPIPLYSVKAKLRISLNVTPERPSIISHSWSPQCARSFICLYTAHELSHRNVHLYVHHSYSRRSNIPNVYVQHIIWSLTVTYRTPLYHSYSYNRNSNIPDGSSNTVLSGGRDGLNKKRH